MSEQSSAELLRQLYEKVSKETDSGKLLALIKHINDLHHAKAAADAQKLSRSSAPKSTHRPNLKPT